MSATFEEIDVRVLTKAQQKLLLSRLVDALSDGTRNPTEVFEVDPMPPLPAGTEEVLAEEEAEYRRTGIKGKPWKEVLDSLGENRK